MGEKKAVVPLERIENRIYLLRGQKVMLSPHLAGLFGIEQHDLLQATKQNRNGFHGDFIFRLNQSEI